MLKRNIEQITGYHFYFNEPPYKKLKLIHNSYNTNNDETNHFQSFDVIIFALNNHIINLNLHVI